MSDSFNNTKLHLFFESFQLAVLLLHYRCYHCLFMVFIPKYGCIASETIEGEDFVSAQFKK